MADKKRHTTTGEARREEAISRRLPSTISSAGQTQSPRPRAAQEEGLGRRLARLWVFNKW